jgi:ABC-type lipoprotein export system ATPase subunit
LTTGTENISGLGYTTLMATYSVSDTKGQHYVYTQYTNRRWCKMPTGKFEEANNLGTVNQSFQLEQELSFFVTEYMIKKKNLD